MLLKLTIETMLQLIKLTGVKQILDVISDKESFFQLLISILWLNSKDLISLYKSLFDSLRQPPTLVRRIKEDKLLNKNAGKQDAKTTEKKQQLIEDQANMKKILETLISHVQTFLRWLIDLGLQPDLAKLHVFQGGS